MSTIQNSIDTTSWSTGLAERLRCVGPILPLAAVAATLPYALVYLLNLWMLPHYQFFPLPLLAVGALAYGRWGRPFQAGFWFRRFRALLSCGGVFGILCGTTFASPWMGFFGFSLCLAGWLAYRTDKESGRSLLYLALPILLIWQPPYNSIITADTVLIQKLQWISARLSSQWLDMLGYPHFQPGTVLEFAGSRFGVAEACSGIQSFFAVLCLGALLVAYLRRGPLHSVLLLATSPCWALLMNTIRITAIPIAFSMFGVDLSHGLLHDLLGFGTMGIAIGLLLSTDELLLKLAEVLRLRALTGASKKALKAPVSETDATKPGYAGSGVGSLFSGRRIVVAIPILLLVGLFSLQSYDVVASWGIQRNTIDFFRDEPVIPMVSSDAPVSLLGWPRLEYDQEDRDRGNDDLGQRSDLWHYQAPFGKVTVSFDQMFPGWHELTRCYRNGGWFPGGRTVEVPDENEPWPLVIVEMTRGNEHGYLVFSLINESNRPLEPPGAYNYWTILEERLRGRVTPAVRGTLFGANAYQIQLFVPSVVPLSDDARRDAVEAFLGVRRVIWDAAKSRL